MIALYEILRIVGLCLFMLALIKGIDRESVGLALKALGGAVVATGLLLEEHSLIANDVRQQTILAQNGVIALGVGLFLATLGIATYLCSLVERRARGARSKVKK